MDINLFSATVPVIKQALVKGAVLREPIRTVEYQRGIGKTTALVEFAKEYDFTIIVMHRGIASNLRDYFKYDKIISQSDIGKQPIDTKFVYDEEVEQSKLKGLRHVVTGFIKN
jgi:hypothetical protein